MILFLVSYLTLGMIITNPLRSPSVIAFAAFAFWKLRYDRAAVRLVPVRNPPDD